MIAIIPGLLYDEDFKFFTPSTYQALDKVLNDVVAKMIKAYLDNPEADVEVKEAIESNIGNSVASYTLHLELEKRDIFNLLRTIQPDTLDQTENSYKQNVLKNLEYLNANMDKLITVIPARTKENYNNFYVALQEVSANMAKVGKTWTVPGMLSKLRANASLFYSAREKDRTLPTNLILSLKDRWMMALRAIQWDNYCNEHGISLNQKIMF